MNVRILGSEIRGRVKAPTSKSIAIREMIAAFLAGGDLSFDGGSDVESAKRCLDTLRRAKDERVVLDVGESAATLRFLLPTVCALNVEAEFVGEGTLPKRPIDELTDCLSKHGACFEKRGSDDLPLMAKGPLSAGKYQIDGSISSQYISGLMFALPLLEGDSEIEASNVVSCGYIEITRNVLAKFGIVIERSENTYRIHGRQKYKMPKNINAEGDWSAAAFLLVLGALVGEVEVEGIDINSIQGDVAVLELLKEAGANVSFEGGVAKAKKSRLRAINFDATDIPDLVPIMATALAFADGESRISSVGRLRYKESDRISSIRDLVRAIGGKATFDGDALVVTGAREHQPFSFDSPRDHRIAMSAVVAALAVGEGSTVKNVECISKSYPNFLNDIARIGAKTEVF